MRGPQIGSVSDYDDYDDYGYSEMDSYGIVRRHRSQKENINNSKWVDPIHGGRRTKQSDPYYFSEYFLFGRHGDIKQKGVTGDYSDRLSEWDRLRYDFLMRKHVPNGWMRASPSQLEPFLTEYFGVFKNIKVVALAEGCKMSGYNYFIVWYTYEEVAERSKPKIKRKIEAERNKLKEAEDQGYRNSDLGMYLKSAVRALVSAARPMFGGKPKVHWRIDARIKRLEAMTIDDRKRKKGEFNKLAKRILKLLNDTKADLTAQKSYYSSDLDKAIETVETKIKDYNTPGYNPYARGAE
jgi:predicted DNA-binding antitoxin AbrB/MazE fold protein